MFRLTVCVFALFTVASCGERESAKTKPAGEPTVDVSAGQAIAQRSCVSCHRADGAGAAPGIPQLGQQNAAYLVQSIQHYAVGTRRHAVLKDMTPQLSDADIRNVAAYYAICPACGRACHAREGPMNEARSAAACAGCHGSWSARPPVR
jgi:cytochrome c553